MLILEYIHILSRFVIPILPPLFLIVIEKSRLFGRGKHHNRDVKKNSIPSISWHCDEKENIKRELETNVQLFFFTFQCSN